MSDVSASFLLAILTALFTVGLASQSGAQVQDVIWEKSYCLDDRGTVIRFNYSVGTMPPIGTGQVGTGTVVGDTEELYALSYRTAQFLFTRACMQAASINFGANPSERLECRASRFLARRFNVSPHETLQIVEELSFHENTLQIARDLKTCQ